MVPALNLIGHGEELVPGSLVNQVLDDLQSIHPLKSLGTIWCKKEGNVPSVETTEGGQYFEC